MISALGDGDFIEAFKHGDSEAFSCLYRQHHQSLTHYSHQLINHEQQAEEIVTDVFIKLLRKRKDFTCTQDIKSFLYVTTRNACYDYLRCKKHTEPEHGEMLDLAGESAPGEDKDQAKARVLQAIYEEIEHLPVQCRQVFKNIFFDGLGTEQIAAALKISSQAVLEQKNRALTLLRLSLLKPATPEQKIK
jgi:RNA polymerase sigma-70 factor (ECF subfamily)